jgi:pyruvate carboxylase subunit B
MLVVIEAMKMENPIRSQRAGTIKEIHVAKGSEITNGALLVTFEP